MIAENAKKWNRKGNSKENSKGNSKGHNMTIWQWADSKIKHFRWYDISLIKLSVASAILALAKLWPGLLCLNWYWYALLALAAATPIWWKMLRD